MSEQKPKIVPRGRKHPDLQALDALNCSYPDWKEDQAQAERDHFQGEGCEKAIETMRRKQKLYEGDRSELVALDALNCSYPGWEDDKAKAESRYQKFPRLVARTIEGMRNKQKLFEGNRSDPELVALDALQCTYPGWQNDKAEAEDCYCNDFPVLVMKRIEGMRRKQKEHEGGRNSDPFVINLRALKCTYPGWKEDSAETEEKYLKGVAGDSELEKMRRKQKIHDGDRSHPDLIALDALNCSYPGWQNDKAKIERKHTEPPLYHTKATRMIEKMRKKQTLFQGDRSHPDLVALDALQCTYPGWQDDKTEAEEYYWKYPYLVKTRIEGMVRKQHVHEGSAACPIAVAGNAAGDNSVARRPAKKRRLNIDSRMPREDSSSKCVVCLTSEKTHIFQPCGHHCVCADCSVWALEQQKCPYCRQTITSSTKVTVANQKARDSMIDLTK